jgi:hypothetical protein
MVGPLVVLNLYVNNRKPLKYVVVIFIIGGDKQLLLKLILVDLLTITSCLSCLLMMNSFTINTKMSLLKKRRLNSILLNSFLFFLCTSDLHITINQLNTEIVDEYFI